jgi:hypothetical protein
MIAYDYSLHWLDLCDGQLGTTCQRTGDQAAETIDQAAKIITDELGGAWIRKEGGIWIEQRFDGVRALLLQEKSMLFLVCNQCGSESLATRFPIPSCGGCLGARDYLIELERVVRLIFRQ